MINIYWRKDDPIFHQLRILLGCLFVKRPTFRFGVKVKRIQFDLHLHRAQSLVPFLRRRFMDSAWVQGVLRDRSGGVFVIADIGISYRNDFSQF
jgi:hypothetical protein